MNYYYRKVSVFCRNVKTQNRIDTKDYFAVYSDGYGLRLAL